MMNYFVYLLLSSFSLCFWAVWILCVEVWIFCVCPVLSFVEHLGNGDYLFCFLSNLGSFRPLFLKYFCHPLLFSHYAYVGKLDVVLQVSEAVFIFLWPFFCLVLRLHISVEVSSPVLNFSCASSNFLWTPLVNFYFISCTFQLQNFHLALFFIIHISIEIPYLLSYQWHTFNSLHMVSFNFLNVHIHIIAILKY